MELCWNITPRCNANCRFCHRFLNIKELDKQENMQILIKLAQSGVKNITWTGGEALILPYLPDMLVASKMMGIKNKLISNGLLLSEKRIDAIAPYLDQLTISLDSFSPQMNVELGRGALQAECVVNALTYIKSNYPNVKLTINTMISNLNKDDIAKVGAYLDGFGIDEWRLFKFMPLRETAKKNSDLFNISQKDYKSIVKMLQKHFNSLNIVTRETPDMQENKYTLILGNGDVVVTKDNEDVKLGNMLDPNFKFQIGSINMGKEKE